MEDIYLEQKSSDIIFKQYTFTYMAVLNVQGRQISVKLVRSVGYCVIKTVKVIFPYMNMIGSMIGERSKAVCLDEMCVRDEFNCASLDD